LVPVALVVQVTEVQTEAILDLIPLHLLVVELVVVMVTAEPVAVLEAAAEQLEADLQVVVLEHQAKDTLVVTKPIYLTVAVAAVQVLRVKTVDLVARVTAAQVPRLIVCITLAAAAVHHDQMFQRLLDPEEQAAAVPAMVIASAQEHLEQLIPVAAAVLVRVIKTMVAAAPVVLVLLLSITPTQHSVVLAAQSLTLGVFGITHLHHPAHTLLNRKHFI
jgi:hypothetical protein